MLSWAFSPQGLTMHSLGSLMLRETTPGFGMVCQLSLNWNQSNTGSINQSINQSIKQSVNQTIKNNQTFVELWPVKSPPIQQSNKKPIHLSINYQLTPALPINQTITPIIQVGPLCTKPVVKEAIKQPIRK